MVGGVESMTKSGEMDPVEFPRLSVIVSRIREGLTSIDGSDVQSKLPLFGSALAPGMSTYPVPSKYSSRMAELPIPERLSEMLQEFHFITAACPPRIIPPVPAFVNGGSIQNPVGLKVGAVVSMVAISEDEELLFVLKA